VSDIKALALHPSDTSRLTLPPDDTMLTSFSLPKSTTPNVTNNVANPTAAALLHHTPLTLAHTSRLAAQNAMAASFQTF